MLKSKSNNLINTFLLILLSITLIGIVTQLGVIHSALNSKLNIIYTIAILISIGCLSINEFHKSYSKFINNDIYYWLVISIVLLIMFIYQINMIQALTGTMSWDPANVYSLVYHKLIFWKKYFSLYPNILLLLNIETGLHTLLSSPGLFTFLKELNIINMLLIDIGIAFLYFAINKQLGRKYAFITLLLAIILYGISPYIVIPYTDNYVFFGGSLFIFLLSCLKDKNNWNFNKSIVLLTLGFDSAFILKMKPSAAIVIIATIIILIVALSKKSGFSVLDLIKKNIKPITIILIPFLVTIGLCNYYANHNGLIKTDRDQAYSPLHFMAMGLHNRGSYWTEFDIEDQKLRPTARKKYETKIIKQDLKQMKDPVYCANFFIKKQQNNSDIASWQRNTGPVSMNLVPRLKLHNNLQLYLRKIFTQGNYFVWNGYLIFSQLGWLITVIFMVFSYSKEDYFEQILKYTVVGGFVFLLLFEGGSARYMIQYLPFFLALAAYGLASLKTNY